MGVAIGAKCHHCGTINRMEVEVNGPNQTVDITFACKNCGSLNQLCLDLSDPKAPVSDWLCLPPTGFEWSLPAGKIAPVVGDPIYVSAIGEHLSRKEYLERYRIDPEIAYRYMRRIGNKSAGPEELYIKKSYEPKLYEQKSFVKKSYASRLKAKFRTFLEKSNPDRKNTAQCPHCGAIIHIKA